MTRHRLVTLVFSHYNEKARWALDHSGIAYDEQRLMPGFSQLGVVLATRGRGGKADAVSSAFSTPVLLTRAGETLADSTDIALWASAQVGAGGPGPLFPEPSVRELVVRLGRELGPYTRLIAYWHALRSETAMQTLADANVGRRQARAFRALAPLGARLLRRSLRLEPAGVQKAVERVRDQVNRAEERLARGRYLVGDRFTAADLTFASLMAPVLLVTREEGYGATLPGLDEFRADARALVTEMRGTRGGAFALDMFRRHRRAM